MEFLAALMAIAIFGAMLWGAWWVLSRLWLTGRLEARVVQLEKEVGLLRAAHGKAPSPVPVAESQAPSLRPVAVEPVPGPAFSAPPPPPLPPPPSPELPKVDSSLDVAGSMWWQRLLGENPVVRVGIVVFLLGISFLVRLAAQAGMLPPELRLLGASLAGSALLVLGWKFRSTRPQFALPLQGGAVGTLLLVIFAAYRLYHFIPSGLALAMAVMLVGVTGFLAVAQNARSLALFGLVSGFAAPLLLSSGSGNYIGLFTYYALLDAAIFGIAWFRSWRVLHVTAFVATYAIGTVWGVLDYRAERFAPCEIFLWLYYALFAGTALLFTRRTYKGVLGYVDGALTFGLPLATLAIQYTLVKHDAMAMAWTAVFLALHHLLLAVWLWRGLRQGLYPHLRVYAETLAVLGTAFASLALPLALSGQATAVAWSFEGAGLVFLGLRQQRFWSLLMGALLVALGSLVQWNTGSPHLAATLVVVSALWVCAWLGNVHAGKWRLPMVGVVFVLGWAWAGAAHDLWRILDDVSWVSHSNFAQYWVGGMGLFALLFFLPGFFLRWAGAALLLWPSLLLWLGEALVSSVFFLNDVDWSAWLWRGGMLPHTLFPVLFAGVLSMMRRRALWSTGLHNGLQGIWWHGVLLLLAVTAYGLGYSVQREAYGHWSYALGLLVPAGLLYLVGRPVIQTNFWMRMSPSLYTGLGILPWVTAVWLGTLCMLFLASAAPPLPYLPLLGPLDLVCLLAVLALVGLPVRFWDALRLGRKGPWLACAPILLFWPLSSLARLFYHYGDVYWELSQLWEIRALQAGWSLLLTAEALALMWFAARKSWRPVWILGAAWLCVAILKLFLVDLSGQGTVARIVSFLGVGGLMVAIGYLSPLPPDRRKDIQ